VVQWKISFSVIAQMTEGRPRMKTLGIVQPV